MKTTTLKQFVTDNAFTEIVGRIFYNVNNYPYLIFKKDDGSDEKIYFGKSSLELLSDDAVVDKTLLKGLKVLSFINPEGEERIKLCLSNDISVADLFD